MRYLSYQVGIADDLLVAFGLLYRNSVVSNMSKSFKPHKFLSFSEGLRWGGMKNSGVTNIIFFMKDVRG